MDLSVGAENTKLMKINVVYRISSECCLTGGALYRLCAECGAAVKAGCAGRDASPYFSFGRDVVKRGRIAARQR